MQGCQVCLREKSLQPPSLYWLQLSGDWYTLLRQPVFFSHEPCNGPPLSSGNARPRRKPEGKVSWPDYVAVMVRYTTAWDFMLSVIDCGSAGQKMIWHHGLRENFSDKTRKDGPEYGPRCFKNCIGGPESGTILRTPNSEGVNARPLFGHAFLASKCPRLDAIGCSADAILSSARKDGTGSAILKNAIQGSNITSQSLHIALWV